MVKLTPDLIENAIQYVNPVRERELLLRGYKIPVIENMGATLDQFDTIDFTDNDIRKLDGFPILPRVQSLHFNNNRICRIDENIHNSIPNLSQLYLTNCEIRELADIDNLKGLKKLEYLSLMRNPVTHRPKYRLYVIHRLPNIRVLDFRRIRLKERQEAKKLFGSKEGKALITELAKKRKTFIPGAPIENNEPTEADITGPSKADKEAIKEAIMKAKSLEEVEKLKQLLQSGQIPRAAPNGKANGHHKTTNNDVEMEE